MPFNKEAVGRRIKSIRMDMGINQEELAKRAGLTVDSIAHYEIGDRVMGLDKAVAMADAMDCSLDVLACRAESHYEGRK